MNVHFFGEITAVFQQLPKPLPRAATNGLPDRPLALKVRVLFPLQTQTRGTHARSFARKSVARSEIISRINCASPAHAFDSREKHRGKWAPAPEKRRG